MTTYESTLRDDRSTSTTRRREAMPRSTTPVTFRHEPAASNDATSDGTPARRFATSYELQEAARTDRARAVGETLSRVFRALASVAKRVYAAYRRRRAAAATYAALSELDDRVLRDLGFDRSELSSVAREFSGMSDRTREHAVRMLMP
jgi:uncharacterized protein YjiS (DUF1127 family)